MKTISIEPKPFILECDRTSDVDEKDKTIFWIIPRTVRDGTALAKAYGKSFKTDKKGRSDLNEKAFNEAEETQWLKHIIKIENVFIDKDSPEKAYDHFVLKVEPDPSNYSKVEIDGNAYIRVESTVDDKDRIRIFYAMGNDETEEVVNAVSNYSNLTAGSRNF